MKNYKRLHMLIILFSMLSIISCDDYIDLENENAVSENNFYDSKENFIVGLNGCYSTLRAPIAFEWMLTEIRSDNTFLNNYGTTNPQNLQIINNDVFEAPSFDLFIQQYWATSYSSIKNINGLATALETTYNKSTGTIDYNLLDEPLPLTDLERKRISGEASFMRAHHYFNLVRTYGGVFLVDKIISPEEALLIPRSSETDIYNFIIADLKNAVQNCSSTVSTASNGVGASITKWAAEALLAKVYLTLGQKGNALPLLTDIITSSGHSLVTAGTTPYADVFSAGKELNSEIIFAIRFQSGGLGYGSPLSNLFSPITNQNITGLVYPTGTRGGYNNPTPELYMSYASTDKRRDFNIKTKLAVTPEAQLYWSGKHNIAVSVLNDSELDWPVLRYSDVLLMYCEAVGVYNTTTLGYLNQVHTRSVSTALTASDVDTQAKYEKAVADERRWEFAMENQRWFDLLRFNTTMPTVNARSVMKNHFSQMIPYYIQFNAFENFDAVQLTSLLETKVDDVKFNLSPIPNVEIITNTIQPIQNNPGY